MPRYHLVFGRLDFKGGKVYHQVGFVSRERVRYLGQSVLFVSPRRLGDVVSFLAIQRIDHEVVPATIG